MKYTMIVSSTSQFAVRLPSGLTRRLGFVRFCRLMGWLDRRVRKGGLHAIDGWAWIVVE
jgi:hypothetical protein